MRLLPLALVAALAVPLHAQEKLEPKKEAKQEAPLPRAELDALLAETDTIAKEVSALRALPVKKPIARGIMSKAEILKRLIQRLDEDYSPAEIAIEERAMKRLGLMPPEMDYRQTMLDVLTEQIAGFYDPQSRQLYIADWIDASMQKIVLAHEIDHALQDQSFDLDRFVKPNRENGDEQLARMALVEGDGVAVMIEYMFKEQGLKLDPWANDTIVNTIGATAAVAAGKVFDAAPLFMRESLLFPYRDGLRFVGASRRTRPWSDVDKMYARPPLSTEQIMHPEKYRAGEKPVALKIPSLPSLAGWKRPYLNVLGELGTSILLRQHGIEKARADQAAAGWGGDHVMLFVQADDAPLEETLLVSWSSWDAEGDAVELQDAMRDALLAMTRATEATETTKTYASWTDASGKVAFLERKGREVLLVVGAPPELAPKLRKEAWAKWKATRAK